MALIHAQDKGAIDRLVVFAAAALANSYEADRYGRGSRSALLLTRAHAFDMASTVAAVADAPVSGLRNFLLNVAINADAPMGSYRAALHDWIGGFFEDTCQCGGDHEAGPELPPTYDDEGNLL